jgi:hypothetical protein
MVPFRDAILSGYWEKAELAKQDTERVDGFIDGFLHIAYSDRYNEPRSAMSAFRSQRPLLSVELTAIGRHGKRCCRLVLRNKVRALCIDESREYSDAEKDSSKKAGHVLTGYIGILPVSGLEFG